MFASASFARIQPQSEVQYTITLALLQVAQKGLHGKLAGPNTYVQGIVKKMCNGTLRYSATCTCPVKDPILFIKLKGQTFCRLQITKHSALNLMIYNATKVYIKPLTKIEQSPQQGSRRERCHSNRMTTNSSCCTYSMAFNNSNINHMRNFPKSQIRN